MTSQYVTVSFSGGKDSTAMLLHMIELGEHIDEVITVDTGLEFPVMYEHIAKVSEVIKSHGITHTTLKSKETFEYKLLEKPVQSKKYGEYKGYGWPTATSRWCTKFLKTNLIDRHIKELKKDHEVIQCIGLAADEVKRLDREFNQQKTHRHPLVEWGWTEKDCLQYCYDLGYDWGGLYKYYDRVSCWCCPLQPDKELRILWAHFPELWHQLEEWDTQVQQLTGRATISTFKRDKPISYYTARFEREQRAREEQTTIEAFL